VRQLLPTLLDHVDPIAAHASAPRHRHPQRPWVAINMVTSVDGATALDGVSGGLGSDADKATFRAIRAIADVILVAAGTVRAESYGPPRPSAEVQAQRVARGQRALPQLAIVSRRLDLEPQSRVFADADEPPLVLTVDGAPAEAVQRLRPVADIHHVGVGAVDLAAALSLLGELGHDVVVAEGGPSLNGQLIAAGLVDEVNVTWSPQLVGGGSDRFAVGDHGTRTQLEIAHLWVDDAVLLARYVRAPGPS
jgi:5-amino-6-(5-phosphoribosylamino)uracil reductase